MVETPIVLNEVGHSRSSRHPRSPPHGTRGVTACGAGPAEHGELAPRAPEVPLERGQACVERLQPGDPRGDVGASPTDKIGQLRTGVGAVAGVAPASDAGRIVEGHVEPAQLDEQPKVLDLALGVVAIGVDLAGGSWQPARALVEADGVGRDADPPGELADPHPAAMTSLSS